ncbi:MAG: SAM-dependent DNA methyltransferase [Ignavibacteriae bacterium]|nr:SAM-dependent DNA methyltransferase [Ignavibacteriota bacterium]NOG99667.1 SAM-dependent DNA methyltransferase [Ignavibacteriota bacterium]
MSTRYNERVWTGHVISWIQEAIRQGRTVFQDATNDAGIVLESGKTKFPDILLFSDKVSGIIFNGWELKFPDTKIDDIDMLENALEKAERIGANSFVTWNGSEAIIWKIENDNYSTEALSQKKVYPKNLNINSREDLANPERYRENELFLKTQLNEILHDLEQLYNIGEFRQAVNISGSIIEAIKSASKIIIPQFQKEIINLKNANHTFREEFNKWKIYENSTLRILSSSSRRLENIVAENVLAKFTFYNLIGRILFYSTLSENLSGNLNRIVIESQTGINVKTSLFEYFAEARRIDYHAIFKPYFTDIISFSNVVSNAVSKLIKVINEFDFKILPSDVIGKILENLVPKEEKQKFGQYFTSEILADIVSFPAITSAQDIIFDPTSGTGSFLNSAYKILKYFGIQKHSQLLNQIWGNDISHFPAILSVVNLYKQNVLETDNFPRVMREDFFNLLPGATKIFPDSNNYLNQIEMSIPTFNSIISNFPFIRQEDIPNEVMTEHFREQFESTQQAFLPDNSFKINERSDYFTYCIYNSFRFLNEEGFISAITSNAWLGKEYGIQFKKFILDNFHIKYVIKSSAEHWFADSKVSTIFVVLQKIESEQATKFISINTKLDELFNVSDNNYLLQIEDFYSDIEYCEDPLNSNWNNDDNFENLKHNFNKKISVSSIERSVLEQSLEDKANWSQYFISANIFDLFLAHQAQLYPDFINVFRGERTGWNKMFIIPLEKVEESQIERQFLVPYIKGPVEIKSFEFKNEYNFYLFVCDKGIDELRRDFPGAYRWIQSFLNVRNKNSSKTIPEACSSNKPYWYSLSPKTAHIVTAINPYKRLFFCYSEDGFTIDQRLAAISVVDVNNVKLIAALLNSVLSLLAIELKGTSRNLGSLDLNASYFKKLKLLNPSTLSQSSRSKILASFASLTSREIMNIDQEVEMQDRIEFDETIFRAFNIDETILQRLYELLITLVNERVTLSEN